MTGWNCHQDGIAIVMKIAFAGIVRAWRAVPRAGFKPAPTVQSQLFEGMRELFQTFFQKSGLEVLTTSMILFIINKNRVWLPSPCTVTFSAEPLARANIMNSGRIRATWIS